MFLDQKRELRIFMLFVNPERNRQWQVSRAVEQAHCPCGYSHVTLRGHQEAMFLGMIRLAKVNFLQQNSHKISIDLVTPIDKTTSAKSFREPQLQILGY